MTGYLTYYRHQEDEGKAARGMISMSVARVQGPTEDKLKFEVSSTTGKFPRFYLKASRT
jgi:oxysterol-binding protein 1